MDSRRLRLEKYLNGGLIIDSSVGVGVIQFSLGFLLYSSCIEYCFLFCKEDL